MLALDSKTISAIGKAVKNTELKVRRLMGRSVRIKLIIEELSNEEEEVQLVKNLKKWKTDELIDAICAFVAEELGVNAELLKTDNRKKEIVEARHLAIYLTKEISKVSHNRIGMYFHRNHTTITHSIHTINNWIDAYPEFKEKVEYIYSSLINQLNYLK